MAIHRLSLHILMGELSCVLDIAPPRYDTASEIGYKVYSLNSSLQSMAKTVEGSAVLKGVRTCNVVLKERKGNTVASVPFSDPNGFALAFSFDTSTVGYTYFNSNRFEATVDEEAVSLDTNAKTVVEIFSQLELALAQDKSLGLAEKRLKVQNRLSYNFFQ